MLKFASVVKDGDSGSILSLDSDSILSVDSDSSMTPQDGWGKDESAFAYDKSIPGGGGHEAEGGGASPFFLQTSQSCPVTISAEGGFLVSKSKPSISITV